jgi:radical SAM superfamily enzyme YgiQ (UPF0313 family)
VVATYILGIPGETREEAEATVAFARSLDTAYAEFFFLTPFPGTELGERAGELGTLVGGRPSLHHLCFVPRTMTAEELLALRDRAYASYYLRPRFAALRLLGARSWEDLRALARGATSLARLLALPREGAPVPDELDGNG